MPAAGLELRGVRKTYGSLVAVRDLDLTVHPGEVFGFVGGNGAGKTMLSDRSGMRFAVLPTRPDLRGGRVQGGRRLIFSSRASWSCLAMMTTAHLPA